MEQEEVAEVAIDEGVLAWRGQMYEEVAKVQQVVGAIVLIVWVGKWKKSRASMMDQVEGAISSRSRWMVGVCHRLTWVCLIRTSDSW